MTPNVGGQTRPVKWYPDDSAFTGHIELSVAAPAYNEGAGIRAVVENWLNFLRDSPEVTRFEIVICNDGSSDSTAAVLKDLARDNAEVHVIQFAQNQGAAVALKAAIAATRLDWVLLVDSDGQFPIENLLALLRGLRGTRALAAIGVRQKKDTFFARFGTWTSGLACNSLYGTRLRDFNSACKLVWGPLLRSLHLEAKGMNYSTEVTARLLECGVSIAEVEIAHRARSSGASSMRLIRGSLHRLLFVCYLAMRQVLFRIGVLQLTKFERAGDGVN